MSQNSKRDATPSQLAMARLLVDSGEVFSFDEAIASVLSKREATPQSAANSSIDSRSGVWQGWFDGAATPNPGTKAIGCVLRSPTGEVFERSASSGFGSNNEAEYEALIALLSMAIDQGAAEIQVYGDSKLVVEQVSERWNVGKPALIPLHQKIKDLASCFVGFSIQWIPRDDNARADELSRRAISAEEQPTAASADKTNDVVVEHVRGGVWLAHSSTGGFYAIDINARSCSCSYFMKRRRECKHLQAADSEKGAIS